MKFDAAKKVVTDTALYPLHISSPSFLNDSEMIGGTDTQGFFVLNIHTKKVRFINASNRLSTNDVFGAVASNNDIWLIANNGIDKLNLKNEKISMFGINNGIRDHELQGAFYKLRNGIIMFSARSGVIYFDPFKIKTRPEPNDVSITNFIAEGHSYSVDSLLQHTDVVLQHDQNAITIEFMLLFHLQEERQIGTFISYQALIKAGSMQAQRARSHTQIFHRANIFFRSNRRTLMVLKRRILPH